MHKTNIFAIALLLFFTPFFVSAQEIGVADQYAFDENTTVLIGHMTISPDTPAVQMVDLDFMDDASVLCVDSETGAFVLLVESSDSISDSFVGGVTTSNTFMLALRSSPNSPRLPRAGRDTPKDPDSTILVPGTADGTYIYVVDIFGFIHILPHQGNNHPEVLGGNVEATGAGEITIEGGIVTEYNNLSNHFQFTGASLPLVGTYLGMHGMTVASGAQTPWQF
jgi:hypothetical protein